MSNNKTITITSDAAMSLLNENEWATEDDMTFVRELTFAVQHDETIRMTAGKMERV